MSHIARFFNQNVVVARLRTVSGNRKAFSSTATVEGHIQPLDRRETQEMGIIAQKGWLAWFDLATDIKIGDKITDESGVEYKVEEISKFDYGSNQHLEVLLLKWNA